MNLAACSSVPQPSPEAESPVSTSGKTEILWDTWGVPHIFATNTAELFHAFGWAQMESHGDLLLRSYGSARGRAAEYWGNAYLDSDRWVLLNGIPERAQAWLQSQSDEMQTYLVAFADGINAYAETHPERLGDEVERVLPVTATDVLAHVQRTMHFTFITSAAYVQRQLREAQEAASAAQSSELQTSAEGEVGSNGWALAPARTESGNPLLLINPHTGWDDFRLWYEAQLTGPNVDAYGATIVGFPVLSLAFNEHLGWTHTTNPVDVQDLYLLTLRDGGYVWDGQVRPFDAEQKQIRIRQDDGSFREETLQIVRSVHGPVVHRLEGRAVALRVSSLDQPGLIQQYWDMARSTNLEEFESVISRLQLPIYNILYADREGHILYVYGGRIPKRPPGPYPWSLVVPGDTSRTLWTETHAYEDLPKIKDPDSGFLQNANDTPWTVTFPSPLSPEGYPSYLVPERDMELRAQRSAQLLLDDPKISFEELEIYKHSTRSLLADRLLDDLFEAVEAYGDADARRGAEVLRAWDRKTDVASRGAVLFADFIREMVRRRPAEHTTSFAETWNPQKPLSTPDGLARPEAAAHALSAVVKAMDESYGRLDVSWGEVHRFRLGEVDLPANGAPTFMGVFRAVGFTSVEGENVQIADGGESFVALVEFGDPLRAKVLLSYGNATQPHSTHRTDQLPLLSSKELRPVWRTRSEVLQHLEVRTTF